MASTSETIPRRKSTMRRGDIYLLRLVAIFTVLGGIVGGVALLANEAPAGLGIAVIFGCIAFGIFLQVIAGMAEDLSDVREALLKQ